MAEEKKKHMSRNARFSMRLRTKLMLVNLEGLCDLQGLELGAFKPREAVLYSELQI